jgi:hypothetical protein
VELDRLEEEGNGPCVLTCEVRSPSVVPGWMCTAARWSSDPRGDLAATASALRWLRLPSTDSTQRGSFKQEWMQLRGPQMSDQTGSASLIGTDCSEATSRQQP